MVLSFVGAHTTNSSIDQGGGKRCVVTVAGVQLFAKARNRAARPFGVRHRTIAGKI
jgi:hypothetical protein